MSERALEVYLDAVGGLRHVGSAYFHGRSGHLRTSFSYTREWLGDSQAFALAPSAPLQASSFQSEGLPGFLSDAAPDRWGRRLIFRGAQNRARQEGVAMRSLDDVDYLLGVDDWARMGALRLSVDDGRTYLGRGTDVPKLVRLPELLSASRSVSAGTDGWEEVKSLLDAGSSSLGGARPKATVADGETLMVAKFPSVHDQWDVIAWEAWAIEMARRAKLLSPTTRLERVGESSVLLERRFDRDGDRRLAYLSGLSLLGLKDGAESDYAELGDALRVISAAPREDLEELFGRIVLSIAIHNTDDHLRNHGLLRTASGWRLSPLFDVNPNPHLEEGRALPVFGETGASEVDGLSELGSFLGVDRQRRVRIVAQVTAAFAYWESVARRLKCAEREIAMFSPMIEDRLHALAALA